jgi:hypothetical protein
MSKTNGQSMFYAYQQCDLSFLPNRAVDHGIGSNTEASAVSILANQIGKSIICIKLETRMQSTQNLNSNFNVSKNQSYFSNFENNSIDKYS